MSRRGKGKLPESLELLLDTMCNTFGGIMFIALSLIIISQMVSKNLETTSPEEMDKQNIKRLERSIADLEREIADLQKIHAENAVNAMSVSEEQKQLIKEILNTDNEIKAVTAENESIRQRMAVIAERIEKKDEQHKQKVNEIAVRRQEALDKKQELNKLLADLNKDIAGLKKTSASIKPKQFRFAMEDDTSSSPYFVMLKNNMAYRYGDQYDPLHGEVDKEEKLNHIKLIPVRGHPVDNPADIDKLFNSLNRHRYFVWLSSDHASFNAMLKIKRHLRSRGIKIYLDVNPTYEFSYGAPTYKASD